MDYEGAPQAWIICINGLGDVDLKEQNTTATALL